MSIARGSGSSQSAECCQSTDAGLPRLVTTPPKTALHQHVLSPMGRRLCSLTRYSETAPVGGPCMGRGRCGSSRNAKATTWHGAPSSGSCVSMACEATDVGKRSSRPAPTPPPAGPRTSWAASSAPHARTSCGSWTSRMCPRGKGWGSPRSSRTSTRAALSAGELRTGCLPSCHWMRSRWRCGPGNASARTSLA